MRRTTGWALGSFLAVALAAASGCYKGDFANCHVTCATSTDCPGGLACNPQGLCSSNGSMCNNMPDADLTKPQPITVTKTGDGEVVSDPSGITCGTTCMAEFAPLSSVTLTANAAATTAFDGWGGDCAAEQSNTCALTMDGPKTVSATFATHGAKRWVKQISFTGQDYVGSELDVDANGDVIAAGKIDDNGVNTLHVVKYAKADGAVVWEKKISATNFGFTVGALTTDPAGDVYVCSRFQGQGATTIGGVSVTGDIFGNVLAMRLAAATGDFVWVKQWGGTAQELCEGAVVLDNFVYFTGYTSSNPSTFDAVTFTGSTNDGFIVRAPIATGTIAAGNGRHLDGPFRIEDIAANTGNVAITGSISGAMTTQIPSCNLSITSTGDEGFVLNFRTSDLTCTWGRTFGSTTAGEATFASGIAAVPGGGFAVTGFFQGAVLWATSGSSIVSKGMSDAFIARYDAAGTHVWSFGYGTTANEGGRSVGVTPTGEVVFAGEFASSIQFGTHMLTGATNDVFVTRMSAGNTPVHEWAIKVGGTASEFVSGVDVDPQGTVSVLAYFTGMSEVAGTPLTAQDYDAWVASFVR
jgi:hypothetical protein